MKLGLQGITFVVSSGDYGVAGNGGRCCTYEGYSGGWLNGAGAGGAFNPSFPGTCPYITSVGAIRSSLAQQLPLRKWHARQSFILVEASAITLLCRVIRRLLWEHISRATSRVILLFSMDSSLACMAELTA